MKKRYLYIVASALGIISIACNEEPFSEGGEGRITLKATVNSEMAVVTRTDNSDLQESLMVWISNDKGLVRRYNSYDEIPSKINLVSGGYVAEAWAGDSVPASFTHTWYKGSKSFEVTKNSDVTVEINCKIANVGVSVNYDENISNVLENPIMVVGHKGGNLTFANEDAGKRGYFMMPSYDKNLTYTLTGIQIDGSHFEYTGTIENAKPATEYVLNVKCNEKSDEVGGAIFTIIIDEKEIIVNNSIDIVVAPKIQGYDFDVNGTIVAEEGKVGRRSIYISSATKLKSVEVKSELFKGFSFLNGEIDFDLLLMTEEFRSDLEGEGIFFKENYDEEKDQTLLQLNFEKSFTEKISKGDYELAIKATDINGKSAESLTKVIISDATVITSPIDNEDISYTSVILRGVINNNEVIETAGFLYREVNVSEWNYIEGTLGGESSANNSDYYAKLTGLKSGTEYEYKSVTNYGMPDAFESPVVETFTTNAHQQLPNAGFEEWSYYTNSSKKQVLFPGTNYSSTFWDSGNHGTATVGATITQYSTDYVHEGKYSACLKSQNFLIQFAAGNIFAGQFIRVSGTNGVTGFGRPFTDTPVKVRLWVKYTPGNKNHRGSKAGKLTGGHDEGQIYIALADDHKENDNEAYWPIIVNTGTAQFFDKDGRNKDHIIAYGEKIFTEATVGDELVPIEIELEYYQKDVIPSNIIFVASSSRYGDYFEGYDDSVMYLDDIELIYED